MKAKREPACEAGQLGRREGRAELRVQSRIRIHSFADRGVHLRVQDRTKNRDSERTSDRAEKLAGARGDAAPAPWHCVLHRDQVRSCDETEAETKYQHRSNNE